MQHKLAVVILNYNGKRFLEQFLGGVISSSAPHTVIVADNASTDDSVAFLRTNFPQVTLIQNPSNNGYAGGYNQALKHVDAEYYILLNNDVEVSSNWLLSLINLMDKDPKIAACQPKLLDHKNRSMFEYAGASGGYVDRYGYPFCRGRIFETLEEDKGQYNDVKKVFWVSGACLMVRSKVFWQVGGFDADYFAHMEEIDLCWRIQNLGFNVVVDPRSSVFHVGGGTLNKQSSRKTYLNFRNSLITLTKNHPSQGLFFKILMRLLLDGVASVKLLFALQFDHIFAILKAHGSYYFQMGKTLRKRNALKQIPGYQLRFENAYKKSIVYTHFIKGVKKFSDLKIN